MNIDEFNLLGKFYEKRMHIINSDDLKNKSDRTLLYGYTCDRDTWHVYIKDEVIYTIWYNAREYPVVLHELPNQTYISNDIYVPNKRLYPECCDYEFCTLLKEKGVELPFTTWDDSREAKQFYGLINSK